MVQDILGVKEWYDPETEELLDQFRKTRDLAKSEPLNGNADKMRAMAHEIARRSESLSDMMARELAQFDRQFARTGNGNGQPK